MNKFNLSMTLLALAALLCAPQRNCAQQPPADAAAELPVGSAEATADPTEVGPPIETNPAIQAALELPRE